MLNIRHGNNVLLPSISPSSHLPTFNSSRKRLILDNQPDGVRGIEYYGTNLTFDSFHFHHRTDVAAGNPCLYRIRRKMKAAVTVGVRCRAVRLRHAGDDVINTEVTTLVDQHGPPVFTATPRFSLVDFSDSFFDYEGLWAMFAAFHPHGDVSVVWGMWAQRLLQEIGAHMALTSLPCGSTSEVYTMPDSPPPQGHSDVFSLVNSWECPRGKSFYACAISLAGVLQGNDYVSVQDVDLLKRWFLELDKSGYVEPVRVDFDPRMQDVLLGCVIHTPILVPDEKTSKALHSKPGKLFPNIEPKCKDIEKRKDVTDPFKNYTMTNEGNVQDIALVVIFYDASIYSNIQFLEDLYRKYFKVLIYCGPDSGVFQTFYKSFKQPLTYIEVPDTKGFVAYECVSRAIMLNYDVSGYLEMADDVILNSWTLGSIPRDKFWFQKDLRIANRHQQMMLDFALSYPFPWWPWTVHGQMWGAKAMAKVWKTFENIRSSNNTSSTEIVNTFLDVLEYNSGNDVNFFYCSSDIFYVPALHRQAWSMLSDIFFTNNVFLDIAVPTLMNGLDLTSNIVRMDGIYLWYNDRANYPQHYRHTHQFFHPWKMGWIHREDHANFMCYYVLPHIVDHLTN